MANNRNISGPQIPRSGMGSSPAMNDIMQRYQSVMPQSAAPQTRQPMGPSSQPPRGSGMTAGLPVVNSQYGQGTQQGYQPGMFDLKQNAPLSSGRTPDQIMEEWNRGTAEGKARNDAANYRNPSVPISQSHPLYNQSKGQYIREVGANGLMTDEGAQAFMKKTGWMADTTVGGAYGQSANAYDGYNKMQDQENAGRDALTEAMRARADRVGLYSNAQRERDAVDVNAAEAQRASQIGLSLPLSVAPPSNPMRGDPSKVGPRYSARAMPSEDYAQEMAGRNALVNMRGIQRGQDRLMRMGQTPIGAMTSPLYQQQVMNSQLNESRDIAGLRNEGQWGNTALQGMNTLADTNARGQSNLAIASQYGQNDLRLEGVKNEGAAAKAAAERGIEIDNYDRTRRDILADREYTDRIEGYKTAAANVEGMVQSGKMSPQDGMAKLNDINNQRQQYIQQRAAGDPRNGQVGQPGVGPQGGQNLYPSGNQMTAVSPYPDPAKMNYDQLYMGGKVNQQQREQLMKMLQDKDYEGMLGLEQRYQIDPRDMNKFTNQYGDTSADWLGRNINIHSPGYVGRINADTGESSRTFGQMIQGYRLDPTGRPRN